MNHYDLGCYSSKALRNLKLQKEIHTLNTLRL